ncbi:aminoglycoside/choline kinase family phosphotransferase [Luteibacter jiangsuensis]|uniref:Aminoglycoside/choline kinase family phosphotransferase n=1 Tax=Luteibacter jiangsuensis TaxID=637577 RepID=A0ABT9T4E6_9GAMM|nr:phosphotransferase [Luteibacter jiangsuensis]MDQ0011468.1 aminoglycoside/choline kinase family phosphotransferase [Luteibacter jiangsuensis]
MTASDRSAIRLAWARHVTGDATLALDPASADASFRSYWRGHVDGQPVIVMDSPPEKENPAPWVEIGERLARAGLHVPKVMVADLQQGFLLIEDLGTRTYLPELNDASVDALYGDALDALLRMQAHVDTRGLPSFDHAWQTMELEIMPSWFLERHLGVTLACGEWDVVENAFTTIMHVIAEQPRAFMHRDYHSRNLLVTEERSPGIIDFQGAMSGPITYDLASLLRDAYIVWDNERVEGWVEAYRLRLLDARLLEETVDTDRFRRWFDLTGLQRHIKILGLFCRLCYRDGKPGYLNDLPRVLRYVLDTARRHADTAPLADLIEATVGDRDLRVAVDA